MYPSFWSLSASEIGFFQQKVLHNLVNYKSFGFTKIVPRVSEEKFAAVVEASANSANATPLWNEASLRSSNYRNRDI